MRGIHFIIILFILAFSSCRSGLENALFEMRYDINFTISPGLAPTITHIYTIEDIHTQFATKLQENNVADSQVANVNTSFARLYDVFGTTDLNFIDKIEVYLYNPDLPNQKWLAAIEDPVLYNVKDEIKIFPAITDFKDIVSEDAMNMEIKIRLRDISPEEISCRLELELVAQGSE